MVKRTATVLLLVTIIGLALLSGRSSAASTQNFQILSGQAQQGMVMSLTANPGVIEPADSSNSASLVGVVTPNSSNIDTSNGGIIIQTDGEADALVSTLGGNILVGDKITSSALEGIGQKLSGSGWVVGTAQASLDATTRNAAKSSVTDSKGIKHTVYVALIPLAVHVTYYDAASSSSSWVPQPVMQLANSIAGKDVTLQALLLSFFLFVVGVIIAGVIIVSAIRSGFLAISRQPLSKFVVVREEWRSFATAIAVLIFVGLGCFLLLKFL